MCGVGASVGLTDGVGAERPGGRGAGWLVEEVALGTHRHTDTLEYRIGLSYLAQDGMVTKLKASWYEYKVTRLRPPQNAGGGREGIFIRTRLVFLPEAR